jgi:hypothetical protein
LPDSEQCEAGMLLLHRVWFTVAVWAVMIALWIILTFPTVSRAGAATEPRRRQPSTNDQRCRQLPIAPASCRSVKDQPGRKMQRNPRWDVPVSIG